MLTYDRLSARAHAEYDKYEVLDWSMFPYFSQSYSTHS